MSNKTLHLLTPMPEYYNVCQTKLCTYLCQCLNITMYVKQNSALTYANAWILQCMSNKTLHLLSTIPEYYNVCQTKHCTYFRQCLNITIYVKQNTALTFDNAWILQCMSNKTLRLLTPLPEYYNVCQTKHCTYFRQCFNITMSVKQNTALTYANTWILQCMSNKHCTYLRQYLNITMYVKQNSSLTFANTWILQCMSNKTLHLLSPMPEYWSSFSKYDEHTATKTIHKHTLLNLIM